MTRWILSLTLAWSAAGLGAVTLWTDDNIPPQVLARLVEGQDLALGQRYDEAEARIREAQALAPEHPLCSVFLVATLLARVQEQFKDGRKDVPADFFNEIDHAVTLAEAQEKAFPESAYPKLYLGADYGIRGLAKLYAGSYLSSYFDGKKGAALLRQAVAIDPQLFNAYMGLGQFEYYCGTLGGVLQFVLALPGNADKGLAMLKDCEDNATYASWPCKTYRVSLLLSDRKDYRAAEPELAALLARYPGNYQFARAVFAVLQSGINTAALRRSAEDVIRRLEQGWTPPKYAAIDTQACRMTLAKAYLQAGEPGAAAPHLRRLAKAGRSELRQEAAALLKDLPAADATATPLPNPEAQPLSPTAGAAASPLTPATHP